MLNSVFAPPLSASPTDPRFYGIERIDLKAKYGAPLDGTLHPLSTMGLAAAQALYPNIGLSSSTTLSSFAQDTAAWLQAEYDLRTGSGGIIGLCDGALMVVTQQFYLQNADKVWFHGGRASQLITTACGTTPAIRVSNAGHGRYSVPLRDLYMLAIAGGVSPSITAGGVAHTGFLSGAQALAIDNDQGAVFERVAWNGYDHPIAWGDNTYGVTFRQWSGTGCNIGLNWSQTAGLNSMERMRFEAGAAANNNYGVLWDCTFGVATDGSSSQGGSVFIEGNSIDYNIVRQIIYKGLPAGTSSCANSFHVTGNHIETTGACSGTALARSFSQGALFASHNELFEDDGGHPPGMFEVADYTSADGCDNRMNTNDVPVFYSSTSTYKQVTGTGNRNQYTVNKVVLLSDGNGTRMQSAIDDGDILELSNDGDPTNSAIWASNYGKTFSLFYKAGPGKFTLPNDSVFNYPINYCMRFILGGQPSGSQYPGNPVTIAGAAGVTIDPYPGNTLSVVGATAIARKNAPNNWRIQGSQLTLTIAGLYLNGAKSPKLKAAISRVQAGTGRARMVMKGDSTTASLGAGTDSTGLAGARPNRIANVLAQLMTTAGTHAFDGSVVCDNGAGFVNGFALSGYDSRVAAASGGWTVSSDQQFAGGGFINLGSGTLSVTPTTAVDTFEVAYYNAGNCTLTFAIDGAGPATGPASVTITDAGGISKATVKAASVGTHTLNLSGAYGAIRSVTAYNSTQAGLDILVHASCSALSADQAATSSRNWDNQESLAFDAPDITTINLGLNDLSAGVSPATYTANLQAIITKAQVSGDVLLVFPTPGSGAYSNGVDALNTAAKNLAVSAGVPFLSLYEHYGPFTPAFGARLFDGVVHPNAALYAEIAGIMQSSLNIMVAA